MKSRLTQMQEEGWAIEEVIVPKPLNKGLYYFIKQAFKDKFVNKKLYRLSKDGKEALVTEDDVDGSR